MGRHDRKKRENHQERKVGHKPDSRRRGVILPVTSAFSVSVPNRTEPSGLSNRSRSVYLAGRHHVRRARGVGFFVGSLEATVTAHVSSTNGSVPARESSRSLTGILTLVPKGCRLSSPTTGIAPPCPTRAAETRRRCDLEVIGL